MKRKLVVAVVAVLLAGWFTVQSSATAKAKRIRIGQSLADVERIMAGESQSASSSSGGTLIHYGYEPRVIYWVRGLLRQPPKRPDVEVGLDNNDRVVFIRRGTTTEGKRPRGIYAMAL